MWQQSSKITWLKEGYRNTCYFQNKASVRRKKNHISRIRDNVGLWQEAENRDGVILNYYTKLFTSSIQQPNLSFLNHLSNQVDEGMRRTLAAEFTQDEVIFALKQMHLTKASRPDGMASIFF